MILTRIIALEGLLTCLRFNVSSVYIYDEVSTILFSAVLFCQHAISPIFCSNIRWQ